MSIEVEDKLQTLDVLLVNLLSTVNSLRQENQVSGIGTNTIVFSSEGNGTMTVYVCRVFIWISTKELSRSKMNWQLARFWLANWQRNILAFLPLWWTRKWTISKTYGENLFPSGWCVTWNIYSSTFKHHQCDFKSCREVLMALWIEDTKKNFINKEKFESGRVEFSDKLNRQSYQVCYLFVCLFVCLFIYLLHVTTMGLIILPIHGHQYTYTCMS